jgi:hypothetical protein
MEGDAAQLKSVSRQLFGAIGAAYPSGNQIPN